jgi:hypothetical protein
MLMVDFALLFEAPDRTWAEHVQRLIQQGLGEKGSVSINLPGEALPNSPASPGFVVSGVAVCDEPEHAMLEMITAKLVDYDVKINSSGPVTQITVRPVER